MASGNFSPEQRPIPRQGALHLVRRFLNKLHPKRPQPQGQEAFAIFRPGLRPGIEDGVATPDISLQRMLLTHAIPQPDVVPITRPAAIAEVRTGTQERTEHAVLHVKHRHVLMQRQFKPRRRRCPQQRLHLRRIEIVTHGHPFQFMLTPIKLGSERIRHVQRKITPPARAGKGAKVVVVAN